MTTLDPTASRVAMWRAIAQAVVDRGGIPPDEPGPDTEIGQAFVPVLVAYARTCGADDTSALAAARCTWAWLSGVPLNRDPAVVLAQALTLIAHEVAG